MTTSVGVVADEQQGGPSGVAERGSWSRRLLRPDRREERSRRLRDSDRIRRRRALLGLVLLILGLGCVVFGVAASRAAPPAPVELDPDGVTAVPATHFYQSPWVLYGQIEDPRRVPDLEAVGCAPRGDLRLPTQPEDLTTYGSRVVDGVSIAAIALLSRSGDDAAVECTDASGHAPLWLMPSTVAEPFTATGIAVLGALLVVAGALVHPATDELPSRRRSRQA